MSLIGALNIGSSALAAQQAAIQVTGNNISNAGNADYARETANLDPNSSQQISPGIYVGTGVDLASVSRQIDQALNTRLRASNSDTASASTTSQWLSQIQTAIGALGNSDLSTQFTSFFNSWSNLANTPQDSGLRAVVLQNGQALAQQFQGLNSQFGSLQTSANQEVSALAGNADQLASQIAALNVQIANSQTSSGSNNSLNDQRDADLKQLSSLINISTVPQSNGMINVYVGSNPLVIGNRSNGVQAVQTSANGALVTSLAFKTNKQTMNVTSGQIGGLIGAEGQIQSASTQINSLAHGLIAELNKVYSNGQGMQGFQSVTAANAVADPAAALNGAGAGLKFPPTNGSFVVHVTDSSGLSTSTLVQVNLSGSGTQTSLGSLAASLNGITGVSATIQGGKLKIASASSQDSISFSQDSSGALTALGVNTFFTGSDASNIGVNQTVASQPALLAASANGDPGDNGTAKAIAALASQSLPSFNGQSLNDAFQSIVNNVGAATATAKNEADAATSVNNALLAQQQSLSGVSIDEETVNLMQQQRAYQAAAQLITTVNTMMTTLMNML